jgi:hypothetical protein
MLISFVKKSDIAYGLAVFFLGSLSWPNQDRFQAFRGWWQGFFDGIGGLLKLASFYVLPGKTG